MSIARKPLPKEDGSQKAKHQTPSLTKSQLPSKQEVLAAIPKECFERNLLKSFAYLILSVSLTGSLAAAAYFFLPFSWAWLPAWIVYAILGGTCATGCWVIAHECGHRAFSKNQLLQDVVGFTLHSALLVPYFAWQRSHALHHARTNHLDEGETFVPVRDTSKKGRLLAKLNNMVGDEAFALWTMLSKLVLGWPLYLMTGASGAPTRGVTNHFWPMKPFSVALFPGKSRKKIWISSCGVSVVLLLLGVWAYAAGSFVPVLGIYFGPYLVVNFWLVLYTWLQHTDVDVPHFADEDWSWVLGAFMTIDRPYGPVLDLLHHRIGSTHVAHHIDARIPHYNAKRATEALKDAFPDLYLFDPTPIPKALWRVATKCNQGVTNTGNGWTYASGQTGSTDAQA